MLLFRVRVIGGACPVWLQLPGRVPTILGMASAPELIVSSVLDGLESLLCPGPHSLVSEILAYHLRWVPFVSANG